MKLVGGLKITVLPMYLNRIPTLYQSIPEKDKAVFKKNIEDHLLRTFQEDLPEKAERFLNIKSFGPLPLIEYSVQLIPEIYQLYVNGLFFSTVAVCGATIERICFDIFRAHKKCEMCSEIFQQLNFNRVVEILFNNKMIIQKTRKNLFQINDLRIKYVHFKESVKLNPEKDAKKAMNLLLDVFGTEIGPGKDALYTISKGNILRNPIFKKD